MAADDNNIDPTRSFTVLATGTRISHYKVINKIGAGGMGEVYLAEDTELNRKVALKFLSSHLCQDEECRARFKREAQAAAKLSHPNIITIHEVNEYQNRPYFAMEHVEGRSLRDFIKDKKPNLEKIIDLASQICEGLQEAHENGIVHRDIKPSNVILNDKDRPKLLDFGLATIKGSDKITKTGSTLGTVGYMSPEQVQGAKVDQRSDLFSLGVLIYEMVAGKVPFAEEYEAAVLHAIVNETPEPLARYKTGVPEDFQRIVSKLLEKDPALRYQSAADVLSDMKRLKKTGKKFAGRPLFKSVVTVFIIVILVVTGIFVVSKYFLTDGDKTAGDRVMLAVLPFVNLGDPEDEYFADGITDEIISRLAKLSKLGVISRTSVIQYKISNKSLPEIASELGVDYILEGTIRWDKTNDTQKVRVTPQLIQVSDNTHIWSEVYERAITSIFNIQSDIASKISNAFGIVLLSEERDQINRQPTENFEAYQYYLRAWSFLNQPTNLTAYIRTGIAYLDSAIAEDSGFALAYTELSVAHSRMYHHAFAQDEERKRLAKETVDRALELEPDLPEAKYALGSYYYLVLRDYEQAILFLEAALKEKPNDSRIYSRLGFVKRRSGLFDEAVENLLQALRLNPRDAGVAWEIADTYSRMKKYVLADEYCQISLKIEPNLPDAQIILVRNYWRWFGSPDSTRSLVDTALIKYFAWIIDPFLQLIYDGDYLKAVELCDSLPNNRLLDDIYYYSGDQLKGWAYFLNGNKDSATTYFQTAAKKLEEKLRDTSISPRTYSELGIVYAYLDKTEEAIRNARRAVELLPVSKDAYDGADCLRDLAMVLAIVGDHDMAIDLVDSLLRFPSTLSVPLLRLDKRWLPLYNNPRFQALIERYEKIDYGT